MSIVDISIISQYIKNCNNVDFKDIQDTKFSQLKSYLKILGIPYMIEGTNIPINSEVMESFIKSTYIFDNVNIVSKPHIIKVSSKIWW